MSKNVFCHFCNGDCVYRFSSNSNSKDSDYIASPILNKIEELLFRRSNLSTAMLEKMVLSRSGISVEFISILWQWISLIDLTASDRAVFLDRLNDVFHLQHGGNSVADIDDNDMEGFRLYNLIQIVDESEVIGDDVSLENADDLDLSDDPNELSDPNDYSDEDYL